MVTNTKSITKNKSTTSIKTRQKNEKINSIYNKIYLQAFKSKWTMRLNTIQWLRTKLQLAMKGTTQLLVKTPYT